MQGGIAIILLPELGRVSSSASNITSDVKRVPDTVSDSVYIITQSISDVVDYVTDLSIVNLGMCVSEFPRLGHTPASLSECLAQLLS